MANDVVHQGLAKEVTRFLDEVVGKEKSSASKVHSILQDTLKRKQRLENELQEAEHRTPGKIQDVLDRGCSAVKEIKSLQSQQEELTSKVNSHLEKVHPLAQRLSALASQIAEVERFRAYANWIQRIQSVSCQVQHFVEAGQLSYAVGEFSVLTTLGHLLADSACCNLTKFVTEMQIHWHKILLNKLASEFDEITKALKWPFTSLSTAPPLSTTSDIYSRLENVFILLLNLQDFKDTSTKQNSSLRHESEILLPLDWLLKPLRKRFRFHFYGSKQTNNLEKPEWYFTQVLNWIRNHSDFLEHTIQPILQKTEFSTVNAKTEFIRGLLVVVVEKMKHSIPQIINDDMLFSHFIDEVLLFDKEVHLLHSYPSTDHGCLHVLVHTPCLERWIGLEKQYAISNMESLLSSASAWTPKYRDVAEVDDTRTPECAEAFMTLLSVISGEQALLSPLLERWNRDRYRNLPDVSHQEGFLDVQLFLLDSFISRLTLEAEESSFDSASLHYCSVANTANYIILILQEWSELMLFLKLQQYRSPIVAPVEQDYTIDEDAKVEEGEGAEDSLTGSVFTEAMLRLQDLKEHMIDSMVKHCEQGFSKLSKPFKKNRWQNLPSSKDLAVQTLSSSACEMLLFLKGRLHILQEQLATNMFNVLWKNLARALNSLIYNEIILENHFNDGGAAQLQFDLTKNLFTLFLEYTQKPENFFKEVKEACILLNLLPGSAVLLRDLLESSKANISDGDELSSPRAALNDAGVYRLSCEDALTVLKLKINWPTV